MEEKIIDIEHRRSKVGKKKSGSFRFLIWLIALVAVLGGVLYIILDMAVIRDVVVIGNEHYTRTEIVQMIDLEEDANIVDVYFGKEIDYSGYPYIKSVEVLYQGLNILQIIVVEKDVVSYLSYQGRYLALDKDGYVIDYLEEIEGDAPLVEGLYIESAVVGQQLDLDEQIINALLDLHHLRSKYDIPLTLVEFPFSDGSVLYVHVNDIKIVLGETVDLDTKMKNASEVLQILPMDASGTLDLQEDKDQFIFKKNTD